MTASRCRRTSLPRPQTFSAGLAYRPGRFGGRGRCRIRDANPKAAPANLANALITAYCSAVIANASVEQSLQRAWLQDFGAQVVQTLQSRGLTSKKG
jgi:hypothetical protein